MTPGCKTCVFDIGVDGPTGVGVAPCMLAFQHDVKTTSFRKTNSETKNKLTSWLSSSPVLKIGQWRKKGKGTAMRGKGDVKERKGKDRKAKGRGEERRG